jgi:hypothetical protein
MLEVSEVSEGLPSYKSASSVRITLPAFFVLIAASCADDDKTPIFFSQWICPRHKVACECSPVSEFETRESIESIVQGQWGSESDRHAVMKKLSECGIKSAGTLRRVVSVPAWGAKVNRAFWHRYADHAEHIKPRVCSPPRNVAFEKPVSKYLFQ